MQAYASRVFEDSDSALAWKCKDAAKEDYGFALERFNAVGLEEPYMSEHTASASLSQYYAAACWAAVQIFESTRDEIYAVHAAEFASKLWLAKIRRGRFVNQGILLPDESKKTDGHFSHQP